MSPVKGPCSYEVINRGDGVCKFDYGGSDKPFYICSAIYPGIIGIIFISMVAIRNPIAVKPVTVIERFKYQASDG